jgi:uncharacterized membrane protein
MRAADAQEKIIQRWLLAGILLLAAGLRLYGLDANGIWLDEALTWEQVIQPAGAMLEQLGTDVHPPLYFLLLNTLTSIFGTSEFLLRLPSALFGLLSVALVFPVARELCGRQAALYATLIAALSLFWIYYAQEARMYSQAASLALLSVYCFLRICRRNATLLDSITYVLATTALLYTHVFGAFIVIAQNVYMVLHWLLDRNNAPVGIAKWLLLQTVSALLFLPWISVLLGQIDKVQRGFWITQPGLSALMDTANRYAGSFWLSLMSIALIVFAFARSTQEHAATTAETQPAIRSRYFLALWLLLPIALPFAISLLSQPIYFARYTIVASGAWYILVGWGIAKIPLRLVQYALASVFIVLQLSLLPGYFQNSFKPDWRAITAYVDDHALAGDLVLFHNFNLDRPFNYYSLRKDIVHERVVDRRDTFVTTRDPAALPRLAQRLAARERVWVVLGFTEQTEFSGADLRDTLGKSHRLTSEQKFRNIQVLFYEQGN